MSLKNLAFIVYIFIGASIDTSTSVPVHTASNDDVVQVTLLAEDSNPDFRVRRAADSNLPDHLSFGFLVQGENIELRLKRARLLPTITSGSVDANRFSQDAAVYTDMTRGSAMIVKRDTEGYRLKGSFLHANQEWSMEPVERQRRDAGKGRFFGLTHKIAMGTNNKTISLSGDAVIDTEEREELVKLWRRQGRGSNQQDGQERNNRSSLLPPRQEGERSSSWGRGRQQGQNKGGNSRHKRAAIQHVIEIAFVVDNADYQKWVTLVGAGNAIAEMVLWYTFVAESIRIRFETIVDPDIAITITATVLRILNNPVDSDFIDSLATVNGTFDGGASLQAFRDWIPLQSDIIPLSDHYMLFTGYNMDYAGGKAFMSSVCKASGVSVIENSFSGFTGGLAAHELGHSLSALHDVDKAPTCDDSTQYVMATIFKIPANAGNEGNQWRFSLCSINSFKTYLSGVTCTLPENTSGLDELPAPGVSQRAGEVLDINTQCQLALNYPDSVFCEGVQNNNGGLAAVCKIMFCLKSEGWCVGTIPQEYTSCGTGKWCEAGLCVDIPVETTTISTAQPTTVTASLGACDAAVDLTVLLKSSAYLGTDHYSYELKFFDDLRAAVYPSQNDVRMRLMFYNNHVFQYYSDYVSYEDRSSLWTILMNTKSNDNGSDVIMGLTAASRLDPVATCRRKRGARRIVVVVADEVDDVTSPQPATFWNMMEERGVDVLMLAVGNHSSLALLDNYLDLNGRDRIIKLDDYIPLYDGSVLGIVKEEVCKVTPEMASYRNGLSASFRVNFTYNGHTYYLSKDKGYNLTQMHQTCSSAGGYLAVMNDKQEYNYMKQYFIDNDLVYGFYLDGTDAHIEGMWTLFSGEPLPFVDWKPGQPKLYNRDRSCLLWSSISHKMFDDGCFGQNHPTYRYRFLCEVPDTCDA